ncbi:TlpA disulfide reductase family protein [Caballeronia sp. LZ032]|uniref:TlpA family protein disulfide reductase n=1 Tax=Caballeronia sp. LZ032 TaxID=3038565 RepID=UPI00285BCD68|nr:TlpA disulfide reductase family protein [Caballeronia sp. LZ032]MDR5880466.1 TlpA disulfide reductase family protein [Caballeronia sp. LZ032]
MNIGVLAIPQEVLAFLGSVATMLFVNQWLGGGDRDVRHALLNAILVALLVARVAFVLRYFSTYRNNVVDMFDLRDLGFDPWSGVIAGGLMAWAAMRRLASRRKAMLMALLGGVLTWSAISTVLAVTQSRPGLPDLTLENSAGPTTHLSTNDGRPTVVNLWASWCGPCRVEMPALARAQVDYPGIRILFVNQGESRATVQRFLKLHDLHIQNSLLDPSRSVAQLVNAVGFPTTLFYDRKGLFITSHLGPLSRATFKQVVDRHLRVGDASP